MLLVVMCIYRGRVQIRMEFVPVAIGLLQGLLSTDAPLFSDLRGVHISKAIIIEREREFVWIYGFAQHGGRSFFCALKCALDLALWQLIEFIREQTQVSFK